MKNARASWILACCSTLCLPLHAAEPELNKSGIQTLISLALTRNPQVMAARSEYQARQAESSAAKSQFFPTASASMEKADGRPRLALNQRTDTVRLQQPLFTGGRLTAGLERSTANEKIAQITVDGIRLSISENIIEAVSNLKNAEEKSLVVGKSLKKHRQYLEMVMRRSQEGQSSKADVFLAENRWLSVKSELLSLTNEADLQRIRLKQLCQCSEEEIAVTLHFESPKLESLAELEKLGQENSPALQKIDQELLVLQATEKETRSAYSPQVSMRAEHSRGDLTGPDNNVYFSVNFSLGAGTSVLHSINAAEQRTQGKYRERDTESQAVSRTIQSLFQFLETAGQRAVLQKASYESAMAVMEASERLYLSGRKSWQELMNSAREAYQAETLVVDAKLNAWQAQQRLLVNSRPLDVYLFQTQPLTASSEALGVEASELPTAF